LDEIADQLWKLLNSVPKVFLPAGDPRFNFLRWWLVFVVLVVILLIVRMIYRARKKDHP
jgi:hypothetical protein